MAGPDLPNRQRQLGVQNKGSQIYTLGVRGQITIGRAPVPMTVYVDTSVVSRIPWLKELFSIQLFDQAALFNLSKKTRIDEVRRGEVLGLRIGLALEHRLERLVVGRRQSF
jgi:hypothetical protein